jgi:glycosyltransferase involved in cell wall biosynthesis
MAYGRPLLASRVGGLLDLAGDGVVLVPPCDPAALRAALESLLSDPAERARLGVAARDRARAEFSHARTAAELVSAYRDALVLGATS